MQVPERVGSCHTAWVPLGWSVVALCYFLIFWGRGKPNTVIKAKVDDFEIYLHHYESKAEPVLVYFVAGGRRRLAPPPLATGRRVKARG